MSGELVLVTGGSGFLGAHCILALLGAGYRVRTTVRSAKPEADILAMLKVGGTEPGVLPDWLVRLAGLFDGQAAQIVTELGKARNAIGARPCACSAGRRARGKMPSWRPAKA